MKLEIVDVDRVPAPVRANRKHLELYLAVERLPAGEALKLQITGWREAKTWREAVRNFMKGKGREIQAVSNSASTEFYTWAAATDPDDRQVAEEPFRPHYRSPETLSLPVHPRAQNTKQIADLRQSTPT